ncbi:spore coat protein GerQ [Texcoconibacillus texcoconensis]|uniref:Spore germination protein Q n=1 Tax=Texcoconibacillus texcoconensis TaxID=1095777 RepID=A0A840QRN1_9BACI|nr:spore coat protein GerQ [Texcoconibacillus texcoconensis]MBB5174136.1 spore germination protein Q [Texcoconibacillus texcoconensis]
MYPQSGFPQQMPGSPFNQQFMQGGFDQQPGFPGGQAPQWQPQPQQGFPQPQQPGVQPPQQPQTPGQLPIEQSFIENILRLNLGKVGTFYMTFENNEKWNAKVFKGVVEAAGRDHIIISDPQTDKRYLLLMVNLDYVTFDEPLEYEYPYANRDEFDAFGQQG